MSEKTRIQRNYMETCSLDMKKKSSHPSVVNILHTPNYGFHFILGYQSAELWSKQLPAIRHSVFDIETWIWSFQVYLYKMLIVIKA